MPLLPIRHGSFTVEVIDMTDRISLEDELKRIQSSGMAPRLMLHCCCAPCASYVLEFLSSFFSITILFYNPNIQPREEFDKRAAEFNKLLMFAQYPNSVDIIVGDYNSSVFKDATAPFMNEPEGGRRCLVCFDLRLSETAKRAKEGGYEFFATTLSVSPHKNATMLNEIGNELAGLTGLKFLNADFKKRDGYKRSIELSKKFGLYRQMYCGCVA